MAFAVSADGTRIFYETAGSGPPILLQTASFSTARHWEGQIEAFSKHWRIVTWDYRGHGRSEAPKEPGRYTLEHVLEDLEAVHQAAAGLEPGFLGGLSIGGLVSLCYALAHPDRVRALVLINTGPGFRKPEALAGWRRMLERAALRMEERGLVGYLEGRRARDEILGLDPDSEAAACARAGTLLSSVDGLTRFARGVAGPVPNLIDSLHLIQVPTLILVGALDRAFQRAGEVMAAKLPEATHRLVPDAGHVLNLDRPAEFASAVTEFLASV